MVFAIMGGILWSGLGFVASLRGDWGGGGGGVVLRTSIDSFLDVGEV